MAVTGWSRSRLHGGGRARRSLGVLLGLGLTVTAGPPSAPAAPSELHHVPAPLVVEAIDPSIDVADPELVAELEQIHEDFESDGTRTLTGLAAAVTEPAAAQGAGITVAFDATYPSPANVQAVVLAAVDDWNEALATHPSGPVSVALIWRNLGNPGLLGSAGPTGLWGSPSLPTSALYPTALANTLLAGDVNGTTPELIVNLNSGANWYVGTTGNPGAGKIDLYSVVLHELAHGLGFLGSASDTNPPSPGLDSTPFAYDHLVTYNGTPLRAYSNANSLLQSNNLFIDLSDSFEAKLFAPAGWQEGSSFSHLDEATYPSGWPGALMTPSLGATQVERDLDGPTLGVMAGLGWPMEATAITPTVTGTSTTGSSATITWGIDLAQTGLAPDGVRAEAWRNGTSLEVSANLSAGAGAATLNPLTAGASYTLRLVPHANGQDGTAAAASVTINGTPPAPGMVKVSGSGLSRTVSWTAPPGAGITGYSLQRSTDGQSWTDLGSTAGLSSTVSFPAGVHQVRVRAANAYGAGTWGYSIPTGVSAGVVRPVALDGQISRLYHAYFRRAPDAEGFSFWLLQRANGVELASVSGAFASSAEFQATYGPLSNPAFVDLVYANVLGRSADPAGRAYWLSQLAAGVGRGRVMTGFSESAELVATTGTAAPTGAGEAEVYRLYVAFFLRFPDAAGFQYWVSVRQGGASLATIAAAFAGSAEFSQTYGSLSNAGFVDLVYGNVLARSPDPAGAGYWQNQLAAGMSRGTMMTGFSQSAEFLLATGSLP